VDDPFHFNTNNALSPGQIFLERYTLVKLLGRGGMGQVWLVKDSLLGEEIALKFLPSEVMMDRAALEDLKRETLRSRKLSHPHIIKVYDFATAHNSGAISMEYAAGGTLADVRYDLPGMILDARDPSFIRWMIQFAEALTYAHETAGIVHRDLKPQNLMLDVQGNLKLTDFGVARSLTDSMSRLSRQNAGSSGTHIYMSPQQAQGRSPSASDDIYAFGATVYDLLTSKPPFFRGNIQHQIDSSEPDPMNQRRAELVEDTELPAIPQYWEDMVAACLKKLPEQRPATMREIGDYLVSRSQQPDQSPPPIGEQDLAVAESARLDEEERLREESERQERERQMAEANHIRNHEVARKQGEGLQHRQEQEVAREQLGKRKELAVRPSTKTKPLPWIIAACVVLSLVAWGVCVSNTPQQRVASQAPDSSKSIVVESRRAPILPPAESSPRPQVKITPPTPPAQSELSSPHRMAEKSDIVSMRNLGISYLEGNGVEKDLKEAVRWLTKAAEAGDAFSACYLGTLYDSKDGQLNDDAIAVKWYRIAAEKGEIDSMRNLAMCYNEGKGVPENREKAFEWYRKAAEAGEVKSMRSLGIGYGEGEGVKKDLKEAVKWLTKSAEAGDAFSAGYLGTLYDSTDGPLNDDAIAVKWYRIAAEKGEIESMRNLAICYNEGKGVSENREKALEWYRKAANAGSKKAKEYLDNME